MFAQSSIGALRREAGRRPHDQRLHALIDELRSGDTEVARWGEDHAVRDYASVEKRVRHPEAGELCFDSEIVEASHAPDERLVVDTTEPESATARPLPLLRSWGVPSGSLS